MSVEQRRQLLASIRVRIDASRGIAGDAITAVDDYETASSDVIATAASDGISQFEGPESDERRAG